MSDYSDYKEIVRAQLLDEAAFIEATFKAKEREGTLPGQHVTIRPVLIRGERMLQFSYFDGRQTAVHNYNGSEVSEAIDDALAARLKSIQVKTTMEIIQVQFSRKGRPLVHYHARHHAQRAAIPLDLAHDRAKQRLLPEHEPVPFLQAIEIMTADGRVRASKQRKFRQINEFLRLIDETGAVEKLTQRPLAQRPLRVVDLGCGNAALSFATYYYFNELHHVPTEVVGVDVQRHLIERRAQIAQELGWEQMSFVASTIRDYRPERPPDVVLALHACDTATDETLAQAVRWESKVILSAPCCHHHLQVQLESNPTPEPFQPVLRYGILRERLGDILTDTFRVLLLRIKGYQTDLLEFIDAEHTPRNLMIRAVRNTQPMSTEQVTAEYEALKSFWDVTPYLETLLEGNHNE